MAALTIEFPQTVWTVEFGGDEIVVAEVTMTGGTGGGGAFDGEHNDLDGRSTADAHPISAITGLTAALVGLQTVGQEIVTDSTVELTGVVRSVVLTADGTTVTFRAATADDIGQTWTLVYSPSGGGPFSVASIVTGPGTIEVPDRWAFRVTGFEVADDVYMWIGTGLSPLTTNAMADFIADSGTGGGAVDSVNGETGVVVLDAADVGAVDVALVGAPDGVAELDSGGLVPSSQLPSYVDDVIEAANFAALPGTGETGKIYVTLDNNLTFRWSGSAYVEISASLALGETSSTAYRGDRGKTAYDHSQVTTGNPHGTTAGDITSGTFDAARIPDLDAAKITTGTVAQARLGSGSAGAGTKFLADDQTYKAVSSGIADPGGSNDDFLQRKAGAWTHRTVAQVKADLNLPVITTAVAGYTYGIGGVVGSDSAYLNALNKWWGCLCYLPAGSYDRVVFNVLTTGTSTWSMGIYPLNPATGLVDSGTAPLHNIGDVNLSLATGAISVTTSFTLSTPRLVWIGGSVSAYTSTATVRSVGGSDAAVTRLIGAPLGGTIAGSVPNGGLVTGVRVLAGTGAAGVDNFPSGGEFASSGPKIQVRAA